MLMTAPRSDAFLPMGLESNLDNLDPLYSCLWVSSPTSLQPSLLRQVATAIRGAIITAKMSLVPVRRGYWGNKIGKVHTVPTKITGKRGEGSSVPDGEAM